MATFLNTSGTTFYLEELIKGTKSHLVLVSPYLRINARIRQLLQDSDQSGIEIDVVFGKNELKEEEEEWLSSLANVAVHFCENLHAKCYLNESTAIVASMNLYEFSQVHNYEMGILVTLEADRECFEQTSEEALRILRTSEERKSRVVKPSAAVRATSLRRKISTRSSRPPRWPESATSRQRRCSNTSPPRVTWSNATASPT
jgi:phosphatidylserine/phosphatidylglycerophosphate/cardiolipin synthase-like enzyme